MRLPDWEARLHDFMVANEKAVFKWGKCDCILFACSAAHAITGEDKAKGYRWKYRNAEGAARMLRELGQGTLEKTIDANFERIPVGRAGRGDIVFHQNSAGVCLGAFAAFVTHDGLVRVPRAEWALAWRV